jgi:hypothetical protein
MSPGRWLFACSTIYLIVGFADIYYRWWDTELTSAAYCVILSLPLWIKPLAKWVGVVTFFDQLKGK